MESNSTQLKQYVLEGRFDSREESSQKVSGSREIGILEQGGLTFFEGLTIISFRGPERNLCRIWQILGAFDAPCPQNFFTINK